MDIKIKSEITGVDRSIDQLRRLRRELPSAPKEAISAGARTIMAATDSIIARRTGALMASGEVEIWSQGDSHGATVTYGRGISYAVYAMFQRRNYKRTPPGEVDALFKAARFLGPGIQFNMRLAVDALVRRIESG